MKSGLSLLWIIFGSFGNVSFKEPFSGSIEFRSITFDKAQDLAIKEGKNIFVYIYSDKCPACNIMRLRIFDQKEVKKFYNNNFISISINGRLEPNHKLITATEANYFPVYSFYNTDGDLIDLHSGIMEKEDFIDMARKNINL